MIHEVTCLHDVISPDHMQCAIQLGLEDVDLLAALGKEYAGQDGSARAAENLLKVATTKTNDAEVRHKQIHSPFEEVYTQLFIYISVDMYLCSIDY